MMLDSNIEGSKRLDVDRLRMAFEGSVYRGPYTREAAKVRLHEIED